MKFKDFKKGMIVKWVEQITNETVYAKIININSEEAEYLVLSKKPVYLSSLNKKGFEKGYYVDTFPVTNYNKSFKKVILDLENYIKECDNLIAKTNIEHKKKIVNINRDIAKYRVCIMELNQKK